MSHKMTQLSLDFPRITSMCGGGHRGSARTPYYRKHYQDSGAGGHITKGIEIALVVDQLV